MDSLCLAILHGIPVLRAIRCLSVAPEQFNDCQLDIIHTIEVHTTQHLIIYQFLAITWQSLQRQKITSSSSNPKTKHINSRTRRLADILSYYLFHLHYSLQNLGFSSSVLLLLSFCVTFIYTLKLYICVPVFPLHFTTYILYWQSLLPWVANLLLSRDFHT